MSTPINHLSHQFSRWLQTDPLGRYLCQLEVAFFSEAMRDLFGFYALQLGLSDYNFLDNCRVNNCIIVDTSSSPTTTLRAHLDLLPFSRDSIDLIVMPHTLDFSEEPQAILREAAQSLIPGGHIVLTGFNPLSLWGVKHFIYRRTHHVPWCATFLRLNHLKTWLRLLGLSVELGSFMAYRLPFSSDSQSSTWVGHATDRWWPTGAGVYGICAVKQVYGAHRLMPKWRSMVLKPAKPVVIVESKSN